MSLAYIKLFYDQWSAFEPLSLEDRGRLITAIFNYACDSLEPSTEELGNARFVWGVIRAQLDRDKVAYAEKVEKLRVNGTKGGRPKKQLVISESNCLQDKDEDHDEDKDQDEDKDEDDEGVEQGVQGEERTQVETITRDYIDSLIKTTGDLGFRYDGNGSEEVFFSKLLKDGYNGTDIIDGVCRTVNHQPNSYAGYLLETLRNSCQ